MMTKIAAGVFAAAILVGGAAIGEDAALAPPAGSHLLLHTAAEGVQIYVCQAMGTGFGWVFKAPEAALFDEKGRQIVKHFAGPSWEAEDGSTILGEVVAKADAPAGAGIPWLLLRAKSHMGSGRFAAVAFIQRLDTKGGAAPEGGCDAAHQNTEARMRYSATYVFYAAP